MLGSTYLQAKATCDQVSALDAILDKELMLETMQQVREILIEMFCISTMNFHLIQNLSNFYVVDLQAKLKCFAYSRNKFSMLIRV